MSTNTIDRGANTPARMRRNFQRLAQMKASGELKGDTGATGAAGADGADGADGAAATVTVGTVTTGAAGSSASVTNSGTTAAAVLDFTIPKGDKGDTGATGAAGADGATGATGATGPAGPAIVTTKGDLATFDTAVARLPVGTDNQVLSADSSQSAGLKWKTVGLVSVNSADSSTVSNTASETNFDVSWTMPANFATAGMVLRFNFGGLYSTTGTPTIAIRFKAGSTGLLTPAFATAPNNSNNRGWGGEAMVNFTAAGGSGSARAFGWGSVTDGVLNANAAVAGAVALDTTSSIVFQISVQFSAASASNHAKMTFFSAEVLV